ncbi:unnamed protein product [Calypogeia fissa]
MRGVPGGVWHDVVVTCAPIGPRSAGHIRFSSYRNSDGVSPVLPVLVTRITPSYCARFSRVRFVPPAGVDAAKHSIYFVYGARTPLGGDFEPQFEGKEDFLRNRRFFKKSQKRD